MNVSVPVDETLLQQAMQLTHFKNDREMIENALRLLIQRHQTQTTLVQFFQQSPLMGMELDLVRDKDTGRELDL